jgi:RraA family protein
VRVPPCENRSIRTVTEQAETGTVIVVDGAGATDRALWGGKMSKLALERGVAGVVVDGAVRDVDEIEALGFAVFAAAIAPMPPRREQTGEIGVPVTCGGLTVNPGDFVYGDADGVVVVPAALHDDVLRLMNTSDGLR